MLIKTNKITNANVYLDGNSLLGRAEEIDAPDVKHKMDEFKALGMIGTTEFFSGIEKMEMRIKWNSFYKDVLQKVANPTSPFEMQIRGSLETRESSGVTAEESLVYFVTASFKDVPGGNFKQHEGVTLESMLTVTAVKLEINGAPQYEIDVLANIYKVNGTDILANYRANLGI